MSELAKRVSRIKDHGPFQKKEGREVPSAEDEALEAERLKEWARVEERERVRAEARNR
jgi:hypothetical protein